MQSENSEDYLCDVGLYAFFFPSSPTTAKLILYETTTEDEENHFQMPNCVFCRMPGVERMVLISCTDICLKVAFDLNFNLQTVAGERGQFIRFQQHNKLSCSSAAIRHH